MINSLKFSAKGYFNKIIRESWRFQHFLNLLKELDTKGEQFRRDFQLTALKNVVSHAFSKIPYWRKKFELSGIHPDTITSVEDLKKLPYLTKSEVQKNFESFLLPGVNKMFLSKGLTSGTTGTPGQYYRDLRSLNFENAMLWALRSKAGMDYGCRMVSLRGDLIVSSEKSAPPFWVRNFGENKLMVSTYHLIPKYKREIIDQIANFKPNGAFAYPSAAYILALWCRECNRPLPFKGLHTSSETILTKQQDVIKSVLKGHWLDLYGQAERVCLFASFDGEGYQVYSEYGVTELLPIADDMFEVIGSTLHNYAMPLFRYRTGDIVSTVSENGNDRPVFSTLSGRSEDFVRLPDGRLIGRLDLVLKGLHNIIETQIYQSENGGITLRVVKDTGYGQSDESKLLENARLRLGHEVDIQIQYIDRIERTAQNKFRFVQSDFHAI